MAEDTANEDVSALLAVVFDPMMMYDAEMFVSPAPEPVMFVACVKSKTDPGPALNEADTSKS